MPDGTWDKALLQVGLDALVAGFRSLALIPGLEGDEEERTVGGVDAAQHAVAHDRADVFDAGRVHDDFLDFACGLRRALQRRGVRQLQTGIDVSLIFVGEKAAGNLLAEETGANHQQAEQQKGEGRLADQVLDKSLT